MITWILPSYITKESGVRLAEGTSVWIYHDVPLHTLSPRNCHTSQKPKLFPPHHNIYLLKVYFSILLFTALFSK
jgi:hypothetical protein